MIINECVFQYRRNPYKSSNLEAINMKSMKTIESGPQNPKEAIDLSKKTRYQCKSHTLERTIMKSMKVNRSGIQNPSTHASGLRNMWNQCKSMFPDSRIHEIHENAWVWRQPDGWTAMQIAAKAIENSKYHKETQPFTYTFSSKLPPLL